MKLCKDCKHFVPNDWEWGNESMQSKYAICWKTSKVDGRDGTNCYQERGHWLFGCGPTARNFEPKT